MISFGTLQNIYTIAKKIYDIIQTIKNAPKAILDLQTQVVLVQGVLQALQDELEGRDDAELNNWSVEAFLALLDRGLELMNEAEGFLEKTTEKENSSRIVRGVKWIVSGESDAEELAERFHKFHVSLNDVQGAVQLRRCRDGFQSHQHGLEETNMSLQTLVQISQLIQRRTEEMSEKVDTLHRLSASNSQSIHQVRERSSERLLTASSSRTCHDWGTRAHTVDDVAISSTNGFSAPPGHYSGHCGPNCKCQCHNTTVSIIPLLFKSLFGRSQPRVECNEPTCKHLQRMTFSVLRAFRQVTAEVWIEGQSLTHVTLRMPRVVGENGLVWLETTTLDAVRQRLSSRELTVNDVHPDGQSVLHTLTFRLTVDQSDAALSIIALLTEHSVPTDWERNGLTPTEYALWWSLVLWRWHESRDAAFNALRFRLAPYLPQDIDDAHEGLVTKMRWSGPHQFFCRLSSPDLTSIPPDLIPQVNVRDSLGWTPLFYAMLVGPEAIHALLRAGANPCVINDMLMWAARAGADTAISTLVRAGAYINAFDDEDMTVLHWAADSDLRYSINGLQVALELVRHAGHLLNWDMRDEYGRTPLDWAQIRADKNPDDKDSRRILEFYRTRRVPDGAQYLPASSIGDAEDEATEDDISSLPLTSLIRAGLRGDIVSIGDLIYRGAMVNERDRDGRTLLHLIALGLVPNGYRVALELLRNGGWGIDWHALVNVSYTVVKNGGHETENESDKNKGELESDKEEGAGVSDAGDEQHETRTEGEGDRQRNRDTVYDDPDADKSGNELEGKIEGGGEGEYRGEDDEDVWWTALDIAEYRLDNNELSEQEREELEKIRDLLNARCLPPDEEYLWPCMDPDFYTLPIPGAWED